LFNTFKERDEYFIYSLVMSSAYFYSFAARVASSRFQKNSFIILAYMYILYFIFWWLFIVSYWRVRPSVCCFISIYILYSSQSIYTHTAVEQQQKQRKSCWIVSWKKRATTTFTGRMIIIFYSLISSWESPADSFSWISKIISFYCHFHRAINKKILFFFLFLFYTKCKKKKTDREFGRAYLSTSHSLYRLLRTTEWMNEWMKCAHLWKLRMLF
jgi:hypothetical protein